MTAAVSKHLIPVYNKPMIYYPLATMMLAGISDVLVIVGEEDQPVYGGLLGDGSQWGISVSYQAQRAPNGIAEALIIGGDFAGDEPVMLMLGDNLVYGRLDFLREAMAMRAPDSAMIFAYQVGDPRAYGVVEIGPEGRATGLEEKPVNPRSKWAVPGFYLYPPGVASLAATLQPSSRGELEITDLNRLLLEQGRLMVQKMGRGIAWLDTGTPESLLAASSFIEAVETRQGLLVGSPEEAAFRMGYITRGDLRPLADPLPDSGYRTYLEALADDSLE
jgi:glucose-1-phosphate thymidylyltransferase